MSSPCISSARVERLEIGGITMVGVVIYEQVVNGRLCFYVSWVVSVFRDAFR